MIDFYYIFRVLLNMYITQTEWRWHIQARTHKRDLKRVEKEKGKHPKSDACLVLY